MVCKYCGAEIKSANGIIKTVTTNISACLPSPTKKHQVAVSLSMVCIYCGEQLKSSSGWLKTVKTNNQRCIVNSNKDINKRLHELG
jgi:ribosomal protein L24E